MSVKTGSHYALRAENTPSLSPSSPAVGRHAPTTSEPAMVVVRAEAEAGARWEERERERGDAERVMIFFCPLSTPHPHPIKKTQGFGSGVVTRT